MRTPGSDVELAQGFLLTEGVIAHRDDVMAVRYCRATAADGPNTYNVLDVTGVCGKVSLDAVRMISSYLQATSRSPSMRTP